MQSVIKLQLLYNIEKFIWVKGSRVPGAKRHMVAGWNFK